MHRTKHGRNLAGSLALLSALAGVETSAAGAAAADSTAPAGLEAASEALDEALRTDDAEGLFAYVAEDVVMMPPGEPPLRGKAAMRAWYDAFLSQYRTSSFVLADREVIVGESWAVVIGAYEWALEPRAEGDHFVDRGHYVQVWRHESDGRWLFVRELWNSTVPPATPEPRDPGRSSTAP